MSETQAKYGNALPAERSIEYQVSGQPVKLTPGMVRQYLVTGKSELVTDQEIVYFMHICRARGLNPFNKDCYLVKYGQEPAAIIVSIDKLRYQARKSGDCVGWKSGVIVQKQGGELRYSNGLILDGEKLLGGWFEGRPKGWDEPFRLEVNLNGYIKKTRDGQTTQFWQPDKQPMMIAKVAEAQGLRRLWPEQMQGLFVQEEINSGLHDEPPIDITPAASGGDPPPAWCDEILSISDDSPLFDEFVSATRHANRADDAEIRKAANAQPSAFIEAYKAWCDKRQPVATAGRRQRKPKEDKRLALNQQEAATEAGHQQASQTMNGTEADLPTDYPSKHPDEVALNNLKERLRVYEASHKYYVLEAKKRTGIVHPSSLDGYLRLLESVDELIEEKAKR